MTVHPQIENRGMLDCECRLEGERRREKVCPAHANGIPLSKDTFLLLVSNLGFRGVDDTRSVVGQLRRGGYDGPVVREFVIAQAHDDWDLFHDGRMFVREYGHAGAFGVPKGALIGGKTPSHANVFAVLFRTKARQLAPEGHLFWKNGLPGLRDASQAVEWMQFRLNDDEDDIEILQPVQPMREAGFETGPAFCRRPDALWMNQSLVQPVPYSDDASEWVLANGFSGQRIGALRFRFDDRDKCYHWVETGELFGEGVIEPSLARFGSDWVIGARSSTCPVLWGRTNDLFGGKIPLESAKDTGSRNVPFTLYRCADGHLRWFSNDRLSSPYPKGRNPLYCWKLDPDAGFRSTEQNTVFDAVSAGLPLSTPPIVDMPKLLPHSGGDRQTLLFRARSTAMLTREADLGGPAHVLTEDDIRVTGVYQARLRYAEAQPAAWEFAS